MVEQLGGKVVASTVGEELTKTAKKKQILNDLEESIRWVKLHQEGKVKAKSMKQLLNEL